MVHTWFTKAMALATAVAICLVPAGPAFANGNDSDGKSTPIKHIVVIFQENISFDHYFGTYPSALNPSGEPAFHPRHDTPTVNGLTAALLTANPNLLAVGNGTNATNPFRLGRSEAFTNDQNHAYGPEQAAANGGLMDLFPINVGTAGPPPNAPPIALTKGLTMGYFDGNTVTALWNYAQHYAMSDNSFGTTFGPSTPGLLNLVSGQTNGTTTILNGPSSSEVADGNGGFTVVGDPDPVGDVCSSPTRNQVQMSGPNIGEQLSLAGVTWGAFMGGFDLTVVNPNGTTGCARSSASIGTTTADYIPHHAFFQYFATTANPKHTRPASASEIGNAGPANHQYDIKDFFAAVKNSNLPSVSFLKAQAYQDGHAGYSSPLDEQTFIVNVINTLQKSWYWKETAVIVAYDDSDGWYDHVMGPIVNQSSSAQDKLFDSSCGDGSTALPGPTGNHVQGRCGYGPRLPFLVISPWAKENFVDHSITDQSSILRFIEDNWLGGERLGSGSFDAYANSITQFFDFNKSCDDNSGKLILDPTTGQPVRSSEY